LEKVVTVLDQELALKQAELPVTLMNGLAGLSVFYFNYARLSGNAVYDKKATELSNEIIEQLNTNRFRPLRIIHSFSTGLAGVGFTFWHLSRHRFIDFDYEESFSFLDDFLTGAAEEDYKSGICDFLHGAIGIFYHFITQYPARDVSDRLEHLLDLFLRHCKQDEKGLRIKNMILEDVKENEYDLGLAHGLSGILVVLNECLKNKFREEKVAGIIRQIARYILQAEKPVSETKENSLFPTSIDEDLPDHHLTNIYNYRSRLAWCYGDLNIAWALVQIGKQPGFHDIYEKGIEVALSTLERKGYMQHQVGDVFFCHGSSGVAYFYKRLHQETGIAAFREAYDYWLNETVTDILNDSPLWTRREKPFSVLEGLVGLAFVLLPDQPGQKACWDELFLLQ